mmetsp:Transcript_46903/g.101903  ORF Transcript_46903/g.101903 Transcript_46903/m.101903 type:complete len:377 (+) Transcript_46903:116-1246(+)
MLAIRHGESAVANREHLEVLSRSTADGIIVLHHSRELFRLTSRPTRRATKEAQLLPVTACIRAGGIDITAEASEIIDGVGQLQSLAGLLGWEAKVDHSNRAAIPTPAFMKKVCVDLRSSSGSEGPQHGAERMTLLNRRHGQIHHTWLGPPEVEKHCGEVTGQRVLTAARHAAESTAFLETVYGMDILTPRHRASSGEGNPSVRPAQRYEIKPCWMSVVVRSHRQHRVLPCVAEVVHLAGAQVLAGQSVAGFASSEEPYLGVIAPDANEVGANVTTVDRRVGNLEALLQFSTLQVDDLQLGLLSTTPLRNLRHCDDLVRRYAKIHRETGRIMQPDMLHLEAGSLALAARPRKPPVPVKVELFGVPVGVEIGKSAPAQ